MRAWWFGLLLLLAPSPAAEPSPQDLCVITITPNSAFTQVVVRVDEIYNQSRKQALAAELDTDGNGAVDASEESAFENASRKMMESRALAERRLFLDDKEPRQVEFRTELSRVVGPTSDTSDWLITEVRTFDFEKEDLDTHRVSGGNQATPEARAIVEFVVARAPEGWWVHRVNSTLFDQQEVSLPAFDTRRFFTIDFSDEPGLDYRLPAKGGAGVGPWAMALAAVVAMMWTARR